VDFATVALFAVTMAGGCALGLVLAVVRPRDEETERMQRLLARRALEWARSDLPSKASRMRPKSHQRT
jgi:hypothetical protein